MRIRRGRAGVGSHSDSHSHRSEGSRIQLPPADDTAAVRAELFEDWKLAEGERVARGNWIWRPLPQDLARTEGFEGGALHVHGPIVDAETGEALTGRVYINGELVSEAREPAVLMWGDGREARICPGGGGGSSPLGAAVSLRAKGADPAGAQEEALNGLAMRFLAVASSETSPVRTSGVICGGSRRPVGGSMRRSRPRLESAGFRSPFARTRTQRSACGSWDSASGRSKRCCGSKGKGRITNREYQELNGVSNKTAYLELTDLVANGEGHSGQGWHRQGSAVRLESNGRVMIG
jgi:hypothetical protein